MKQDFRFANQVTATTINDYTQSAERFRAGTQGHDVRQNIDALLRHIQAKPPFRILDLGCGPGRDLLTFLKLGHAPVGLDGSEAFVKMAQAATAGQAMDSQATSDTDAQTKGDQATGCQVWHQDFLALDLPDAYFDGVFANASLFHVPGAEIKRVLLQLNASLKPEGVLLSSNPRGANQEGWNGARYGVYHDLASWRQLLEQAGFIELEHYYRPQGLPREQQPWLVTVWRKKHEAGKAGL